MWKIVIAALLTVFVVPPAVAEEAQASVGANYSSAGAYGIQGELDVSSMADNAPLWVQVFWKNLSKSESSGGSWDVTGVGAAIIYNLSSRVGEKEIFHPYVGIALMTVSFKWKGSTPAKSYTGVDSGLYLVGGLKYFLSPQLAADLNYNVFGDLTAGINYSFD